MEGGAEDYLHEAALAHAPPSGTFYDPNHAGEVTRLASLGVHEHWNNPIDKQYSRNLGADEGIELIRLPRDADIYLLSELYPGDADQDLDFDQFDLIQVQVAGKYRTGEPATWGEGDWNGAPGGFAGSPPEGDGQFNQIDIIAALNAGKYLLGKYVALAEEAQGDRRASVTYNRENGEVGVVAYDTALTAIFITSEAGIFTGDPAENLGGDFDSDDGAGIFKSTIGSSFGSLSFGNVAQPGLSEEFVQNDLSAIGSLDGGGDLGVVDLIYIPEPSTMLLLAMGWAGALVLRRRQQP
jgi:hypothetical protein